MQSTINMHDGCVAKVCAETFDINRCGGNDDLEITPLWQESLEVAKQKVNVETAFVRLINDHCV